MGGGGGGGHSIAWMAVGMRVLPSSCSLVKSPVISDSFIGLISLLSFSIAAVRVWCIRAARGQVGRLSDKHNLTLADDKSVMGLNTFIYILQLLDTITGCCIYGPAVKKIIERQERKPSLNPQIQPCNQLLILRT